MEVGAGAPQVPTALSRPGSQAAIAIIFVVIGIPWFFAVRIYALKAMLGRSDAPGQAAQLAANLSAAAPWLAAVAAGVAAVRLARGARPSWLLRFAWMSTFVAGIASAHGVARLGPALGL